MDFLIKPRWRPPLTLGEIKMGLIACAKPRMEVIVLALRQKRLGSSLNLSWPPDWF
jgi:hypothetical protein